MAILKNEPLFPFTEGNYAKPHHIIVSGSDEEIGYDLASLAKEKYDCTLEKYDDPIYGEARREFFRRNWPEMNERSKGIRRAFGLAEDDNIHDTCSLPYDVYDCVRGQTLEFGACSGLVLPIRRATLAKVCIPPATTTCSRYRPGAPFSARRHLRAPMGAKSGLMSSSFTPTKATGTSWSAAMTS